MTGSQALVLVFAAFAGGAFGAAIGALPSFTLCGLAVVVGETYAVLRTALGTAGTDLPAAAITGSVAFGPVLGPHVAFGGGAAAAAYAAREGVLGRGGFDYHPAKRVTTGLGTRPDVLLVGGAFGVFGHLVRVGAAGVGVPVDPVALGVVVSAFAHRAAFGYSVLGEFSTAPLDMSPFERDERVATDGGLVDGRLAVEPGLPHQYRWPGVTVLGAAMGVLGGYVAYLTGSAFLAFGLGVVSLVYVNAGVERIPVTHHMTLPASTLVLALTGLSTGAMTPTAVQHAVPLPVALGVGLIAGVVGALAGELAQRLTYAHAETHLDPPAASIVVTSLGIGVLALAGVLETAVWVPTP